MARPTKLNAETIAKLTQAISMGATYEIACKFAGISYSVFREWMVKGERGERGFLEFLEAIKTAEGSAAVGWLAKIEVAASAGEWQAAAWKLERRYPQEYGKQVTELTGKDGTPLQLDLVPPKPLSQMSNDELESFISEAEESNLGRSGQRGTKAKKRG